MNRAALLFALLLPNALALAGATTASDKDIVVLDSSRSSFRAFIGYRTPALVAPDGSRRPLLEPRKKEQKEEDRKPAPIRQSAPPPADWTAADFNDSGWPRVPGTIAYLREPDESNLVCLRGKFHVTDLAQVRDLRLTLHYHGGAVVSVNGVELCRGHLPEGRLTADSLAKPYPDSVYVTEALKYREPGRDPKDQEAMAAMRARALPAKDEADAVTIPAAMLRQGVNVVAIEVWTAPLPEPAFQKTTAGAIWSGTRAHWPHAAVLSARVLAAPGQGITGNLAAPAGIELVNSQPTETLHAYDYPDLAARVSPIRMIGARNGVFSGKVELVSGSAITNLRASATALSQPDGKGIIPAAAAQVRWAERVAPKTFVGVHWATWGRSGFDRLLDEFPAKVEVAELCHPNEPGGGGDPKKRRHVAAVPVWVTVRVPGDAAAGEYRGTLTIEADGPVKAKFVVPVHLKVNDWRLPDPKDFVMHHHIYQSPDSVARWCDVPLWGQKHFELMGKSLKAFQEVGNTLCVLHLTVNSRCLNNSESMVRWVKKADGTFDYDFTIADKYLDLYEKTCGKPGILRLDAWQLTDVPPPATPGLSVSVFDPATGKVEPMVQPAYGTPENEAFWRPVLTELRKRLEKRGWFDVAAIGWVHYSNSPSPQIVDVFKRIWPDGKWMHTAHTNPRTYNGTAKDNSGGMPVPYTEYVWGCGNLYDPDAGGQYPRPWKSGTSRIETGFPRFGVAFINALTEGSPLVAYRMVSEAALQGNVRGVGFLGGDFWPVIPSGKDDRVFSIAYPYKGIAYSDAISACFSPHSSGAIFNERMEMFREGVQVAEAIVYLQRAIEDKKVDEQLAGKIAATLDERARCYLNLSPKIAQYDWSPLECSGWQERDDKLFALCAEVAAKARR